VDMFNIGLAGVNEIITHLGYNRVCARWVLASLHPKWT